MQILTSQQTSSADIGQRKVYRFLPSGFHTNRIHHTYYSVYGSARGSYLRMLDPIQNHALRLCLGAYRTSPASSLCVEGNEPPLYFTRKKTFQYCLKLSCNYNNPAYAIIIVIFLILA